MEANRSARHSRRYHVCSWTQTRAFSTLTDPNCTLDLNQRPGWWPDDFVPYARQQSIRSSRHTSGSTHEQISHQNDDRDLADCWNVYRSLFFNVRREILLAREVDTNGSITNQVRRHFELIAWNATDAPYARDSCLHQLFEKQVQETEVSVA